MVAEQPSLFEDPSKSAEPPVESTADVAARIGANAPVNPYASQEARQRQINAGRGEDLQRETTGVASEVPVGSPNVDEVVDKATTAAKNLVAEPTKTSEPAAAEPKVDTKAMLAGTRDSIQHRRDTDPPEVITPDHQVIPTMASVEDAKTSQK